MNSHTIYIPRLTPALSCAVRELVRYGITTVPSADEADAILLPVPTPADMDASIFKGHTVIGGNLPKSIPHTVDLLQDADYLAQNAAITAEAAIGMILSNLSPSLTDAPVLILGWGRIGKVLAKLLQALGTPVSICAHKTEDRAMLNAMGYHPFRSEDLPTFRCIVNTAPAPILTEDDMSHVNPSCYLLELASGTYLPEGHVTQGRGLPGKCKPEASGTLIARTVARYLKGEV